MTIEIQDNEMGAEQVSCIDEFNLSSTMGRILKIILFK